MAVTSNYCKAYMITDLEAYPHWIPREIPKDDKAPAGGESAPPQPYYFLHDNYVVTGGIFRDEDVVFDQVTSEWQEFCHTRLAFQIPEPEERPSIMSAAG